MSIKHAVVGIASFVVALVICSCSAGSGGPGDVLISGSVTVPAYYTSYFESTPLIELRQAGLTKYTIALSAITDGWALSSTEVTPGTYDVILLVTYRSFGGEVRPLIVSGMTVNGVAVDFDEVAPTDDGSYWTGSTTIQNLDISANANVQITFQEPIA
jgi:hypothetical protein